MKLGRRERNVSRNAMFCLANRVLADHPQSNIVMEDLSGIKTRTSRTADGRRRTKHNSRLGQVPFYAFRQILTYKAQALGRSVETVSPFMTSQTDCRSGRTEGIRRGCRFYGTDGTVLDADWNAAINIARRKRPISFSVPLDGMLDLIRQVLSTDRPSDEKSSGKPPRLQRGRS